MKLPMEKSTINHRLDSVRYLADSMFDYNNFGSGGWKYHTLDKENSFGRFKERDDSRGTATPFAFLVGSDVDCIIGRDVVHPGYHLRPCLEWIPTEAGKYLIEGEASLIYSSSSGAFHIGIYVDDKRLLSIVINYPQCVKFEIPVEISKNGFVRVVFTSLQTIDHNYCMYYARISNLSNDVPAVSVENQPECVHVDVDESWAGLCQVISNSISAPIEKIDLVSIAHNLYGGAGGVMYNTAVNVSGSFSERNGKRFREPGFYSVSEGLK